jgi:hypothetical protein
VPEVALLPLHAPDAVQEVALVDDHVRVALPPDVTEVGEAEMTTVGIVVGCVPESALIDLKVSMDCIQPDAVFNVEDVL